MSEPMAHFLAYGRLAPVQCLFWGNPVTSGVGAVDYFISGEWLEPTEGEEGERAALGPDAHYSEQVVLLKGQAIWYDRLVLPAAPQLPRAAFGFGEGWVVYLCLQSVFKLHPGAFDDAVGEVLRRVPAAHVVFLEGRQEAWTALLRARMARVWGAERFGRVHFLPRLGGSEAYLQVTT